MRLSSIMPLIIFLVIFSTNVFSQNESNLTVEVTDFNVVNIIPQEFKVGDVQFNIQVENTGNTKIENMAALISGKGFSTYNIVPIDTLDPNEKSYIIVNGNFKEGGSIELTIKIDSKTFYQTVNVIDPNAGKTEDEAEKQQLIDSLSKQLDELNNKYESLEAELKDKKTKKYDLSEVSLVDLKDFLRLAQSSLAVNDVEKLKLNLNLASNEYDDQKKKLDSAQIVKNSFWGIIKKNLLLISSLGGAIITLFAFIELLKRKKQDLSKKAMEVKVVFEKKISEKDKKKSEDDSGEKKNQ